MTVNRQRERYSGIEPITSAERIAWARRAVDDAMDSLDAHPFDRALLAALHTRRDELRALMCAVAKASRSAAV